MRWLVLFLWAGALSALGRLPEEFTVTERVISLTDTFDINTDAGPIGVARKTFFSLTPAFTLEDDQGRPVASAKARFFSWGTVVDVVDAEGNGIGRIEEQVWRILPWAEYRVFDARDRLVAVAKMNFWGTYFELYPPDEAHHIYATIERPLIHLFRDCWTVQIHDYEVFESMRIDPLLLVMLAVYQTDKDNRDRTRAEMIELFRRELDQWHN